MRKINTNNFRIARRSTMRDVNRQIVLNLIREHQPISRAELARQMDVHRSALTTLVGELVSTGAIYEQGTAAVVRGRRPTLLYVRTSGRLALAIDVRTAQTAIALAEFGGRVIARDVFATPRSSAAFLEQAAEHVERLLQAHGAGAGADVCQGIGIVVPGMVDRRTGLVLYAPRLGWRDVDLSTALAERTGLPVRVESAPIACALARLWSAEETGLDDSFAYVSVSDGVGVGLVTHGEALRGAAHTAGEFGHVSLDPNGPTCVCGQRGCWEAFAGNAATVGRYTELVRGAPPVGAPRELRVSSLAVDEVVRRAHHGERAAMHALAGTGEQIGRGLAALVSAFNPARIYVGGEVTLAWELIEAPMRAALAAGTLTEAARATPIVPDRNPAEYRLRGAVALVAAPSFAAPRVG
jgi:N-acetylglucosamine repressor